MENLPIWYVILTYDPQIYQYQICRVVKSIPALLGDLNKLYSEHLAPLYGLSSKSYQVMIIERLEDNPLTVEKEG